jgi:hypothetical protein
LLLDRHDLRELNDGVERVFCLMKDGEWHHPEEVRRVAGGESGSASEGLRRLRALYPMFFIEKDNREGGRTYFYRMTGMRAVAKRSTRVPCKACGGSGYE